MVDLETLGNTSNAVIAQIACVEFNPFTGEIYRKFSVNVDIESCKKYGLEISASTVLWWFDQSPELRQNVFFKSGEDLYEALGELYVFLSDHGENCKEDIIMWANSPSFDLEILKNAIIKTSGYQDFWLYGNERDFRTISKLFPDIQKNHLRIGQAHNALDDCINQVQILRKCMKFIEITNF